MRIKINIIITILTAVLFVGSRDVYAQGGVVPTGAFLGEYYDNIDFTNLIFSKTDNSIDFNWKGESPHVSMDKDSFSVRWRGNFFFEEGNYDFFLKSDDGARLFVDNEVVIDMWETQSTREKRSTKQLSEGAHQVKVEYFEEEKSANIKAGWALLGLYNGEVEQTPTSTIEPTPTKVQEDEVEEGDSEPEVLEGNDTEELPQTGLLEISTIHTLGLSSLFGIYLVKRFKLKE